MPGLLRTDYTNDRADDKFTPRVSASFDILETLTTSAAYSEGFKSGAFDMRGDAVLTPSTVDGYESEPVDSCGIGLKGSSTIQGAELEGAFVLTDGLSISYAIGCTDAEFDKYQSYAIVANPEPPPATVAWTSPSERWGETPLAVVVARADVVLDAAALVGWINGRVGKQQRVSGVAFRDSLPRNPNGKILKRELRVEYASSGAGQRSRT